jgi:ribonuclease VapC
MTLAFLDASAVIALLNGEPGAEEVEGVLATAAIGAVNIAEIVSHYTFLGAPLGDIQSMINTLPMTIIAADKDLSWEAGALRAITSKKGLSLGDRFCLALAKRLDVTAYTTEHVWPEIADAAEVKVMVIRPSASKVS